MAKGKKMSQMEKQSKEANRSLAELQEQGMKSPEMGVRSKGLEIDGKSIKPVEMGTSSLSTTKEEFDTRMELEEQSAEGRAKQKASELLSSHFKGMMWLRSIHPDFDLTQFSKVQIAKKIAEED